MNTLIENYINGNLTDAKRQARGRSFAAILTALREFGYTAEAAIAIAAFLKGQGSFQAACDAEFNSRQTA
jgi:hypothetical protein